MRTKTQLRFVYKSEAIPGSENSSRLIKVLQSRVSETDDNGDFEYVSEWETVPLDESVVLGEME